SDNILRLAEFDEVLSESGPDLSGPAPYHVDEVLVVVPLAAKRTWMYPLTNTFSSEKHHDRQNLI
ncbi:hypothetical protein CEXT_22761, partial [Caerostris extrusa]